MRITSKTKLSDLCCLDLQNSISSETVWIRGDYSLFIWLTTDWLERNISNPERYSLPLRFCPFCGEKLEVLDSEPKA